jgi:hypothetical protein
MERVIGLLRYKKMKILGKKVKEDVTGEYFFTTPNGGFIINPKMSREFGEEFGLADNYPERINKKKRTDSWRRIGKSQQLAFIGKSAWEDNEFIEAGVYKL